MSSFRKQQTFLRVSAGYYDDDGMWHEGVPEEQTFLASVQPLNANEAQEYATLLQEGITQFNAVKIYSSIPLRPAKQELPDGTPGVEADILLWRGRKWKVVHLAEWQSDVINHYRMVAKEVEPDEGTDEEVSP